MNWILLPTLPVCHSNIILYKVFSCKERYSRKKIRHLQAFLSLEHTSESTNLYPLLIEMTCSVGTMMEDWCSVEYGKLTARKPRLVLIRQKSATLRRQLFTWGSHSLWKLNNHMYFNNCTITASILVEANDPVERNFVLRKKWLKAKNLDRQQSIKSTE